MGLNDLTQVVTVGSPPVSFVDSGPFPNSAAPGSIRGWLLLTTGNEDVLAQAPSSAGTPWTISYYPLGSNKESFYNYLDSANNRLIVGVLNLADDTPYILTVDLSTGATTTIAGPSSVTNGIGQNSVVAALPNGDIVLCVWRSNYPTDSFATFFRYRSGSWSSGVNLTDSAPYSGPTSLFFALDIAVDTNDVCYISYYIGNGSNLDVRLQTVDASNNLGPVCVVATVGGSSFQDNHGRRLALFGSQAWMGVVDPAIQSISVYRSGPLSALVYPSSSPVTFTQSYTTASGSGVTYAGQNLTGDATGHLWLIFNAQTVSGGNTTSDRMMAVEYSGSGDTWGTLQTGLDYVDYNSTLTAAGMLSYPEQSSHFWSTHQLSDGTFGTFLDFNDPSFCLAWYTNWSVGTPVGPTLGCGTVGNGQVGAAYSGALSVSGGTAPYTYSIIGGSLPPGLTLDSSTGAITGIPLYQGNYNFTALVTDANSLTSQASCGIAVSAPAAPPTLSCGTCGASACIGDAYSCQLTASGGVPPYTFSIVGGSLPPGLTLDSSTGAITGTPTAAISGKYYNFTVQVTDSAGNTASASCSILTQLCGCTNPLGGSGLRTVEPSILPSG